MAHAQRVLVRMANRGHLLDATPTSREEWQRRITEDPDTPRGIEDLRLHVDMLHGRAEHCEHCGYRLAQRLVTGLRNPDLTDADVDAVDAHLHAAVPQLTDSVESNHFHVSYTTQGTGAVTKKVAQATADVLDNHFLLYKGLFGKAPFQTSTINGKEAVEISELNGVDGYVTRTGPIHLNSASMKNDVNRPWTTAHELFHTVEYAFGLSTAGHDDQSWFVEGGANWAATFAQNGVVDGFWGDFTKYQADSIFSQSYEAFPLWVYLNGFLSQSPTHQSNTWDMKSFLQEYDAGGSAIAALQAVLNVASSGIQMDTTIPALVARYTAAKAATEWRENGSGYTRTSIMPYMATMTNYNSGLADPPPAIPYTGTGSIQGLGNPVQFSNQSLTAGAANLFKLTFQQGAFQGKWAHMTLSKLAGQPALTGSMLSAHGAEGNAVSPVVHLNSSQTSQELKLLLDCANTDSLYVSVVDGRLGGATSGNITYSLSVEVENS